MRYDELYHHGIKGQRWGVRNGPPYPLSRQKGRRVGAYDVPAGSEVKNTSKALFAAPSSIQTKEAHRLSVMCKLPLKEEPTSLYDDLRATNATGRMRFGPQWQSNCVKASYTYALRRGGLDVTADSVDLFSGILGGMTVDDVKTYVKNADSITREVAYNKNSGNPKEKLQGEINKLCGKDKRAYGMYIAQGIFGGHAMAWEKIGGQIYFMDPQNNSFSTCESIFNTCSKTRSNTSFTFMRLDNAEFDEKKVKQIVR